MIYQNDTPLDCFNIEKSTGDIGLEMEVEGENLPRMSNRYWNSMSDGSLRLNGVEYVSNGPKLLSDIYSQLSYWEEALYKKKSIVYETDRTSVHVHLNQQRSSMLDICKGLTAYYLLENALMNYCGPQRKGNLFCTSLSDSPSQLLNYKILCGEKGAIRNDKYSAMNTSAIRRFGSLEQRGMRGYYEPEFLTGWCKNLQKIFVVSKEFDTPKEVFDHFYGRSYKEFCGTFFYPEFVDELVKFKDWDIDANRNTILLGKFLYEHEFKDRPKEVSTTSKQSNRGNDWQRYTIQTQIRNYRWEVENRRLTPMQIIEPEF